MKIVGAAIAAAGLLVSTAAIANVRDDQMSVSVSRPAEGGREQVALQVSTEGLNLATVDGTAKLRKRVSRAIALACNPGDRLDADLAPDFQCRREMAASAEPALLDASRQAVTYN
ncbi:UrcA family protein [Croceibacterium sp. LX-88]|uniref:UrcA family protein n=1 Tax=Croceibacterium selenioxidans TaxID=2838833 RepID=A0ABS5W3P2_9SPHN|nr:UrcA family protein [Croceibacterium selenioxidans]MBT2133014.1 UrcA family protein [Croceibacterium selenioxidans]